jgi:ankyrin repeat protein
MDIKSAIDTGDHRALGRALAEDKARADTLIVWGKRDELRTHPLHYVCDKLFDATLDAETALALVEILLEAGANVNGDASNRETPLIGAASLNAEEIGILLLHAGASPNSIGSGGETALHWAAHQGLHRLVARLLAAGADVNLKDKRFNGTPLDWAEHGKATPAVGGTKGHDEVIALLRGH